MKRPEGFDAPGAVREQTRPAAAEKRPVREKPVREPSVREKPVREPKPPRAPRAAQAELRTAARARKQQERRELRRFTQRTRRRRIAWLVGTGVVVLLVALSFGAVYSPLLALRDIRVDGTARLDPTQLVDAIDDQLGVPLALLDDAKLHDELGAFSLIRSYTTEILPPGTLIVHIVERTPVGSIVRGADFDLVDAAGVVISSTTTRTPGVPVIQVADDEVDSVAFRSIAEVLLALPPELLVQVDAIAASTRDDVTLTLTGSTQQVEWGSADDSAQKARVLAALLAIHSGAGAGRYDVSAPGTAVFHRS